MKTILSRFGAILRVFLFPLLIVVNSAILQAQTINPPTYIGEYETTWVNDTGTKATQEIGVLTGDVMVAYAMTEDANTTVNIASGSGSWVQQQTVNVPAYGWLSIWTMTVEDGENMVTTFARSGGGSFGGNVLHFRDSGGVGASSSAFGANGSPSLNFTGTQSNSAIVVANVDWNAIDGAIDTDDASRSWRQNAGAISEQSYAYVQGAYTIYGGYHGNTGSGGNYVLGLDTPNSQKFSIGAVEIKGLTSDGSDSQNANTNVPILIVTSNANPFTTYYEEILLAEGLNAFDTAEIDNVTAATLSGYDAVILGEIPVTLTDSQVTLFTDWVDAGGNLIAMRPDKKLAALLGLIDDGGTMDDAYLLVDTVNGPGVGIVDETIQFHSTADLYRLNGATAIATLYSDADTETQHPAVTIRSVGNNGGQAAAFTYDLAKSVVYTRQGNPALATPLGQSEEPKRASDLFLSGYLNLDKVAIPQADEQQRLLANLLIKANLDKKPLPRFWYLPRGLKAAVIHALDDHGGTGGIDATFTRLRNESPGECNSENGVEDWQCYRATAWFYKNNDLTKDEAITYANQGFEMGVHVETEIETNKCTNFASREQLESLYGIQLEAFGQKYVALGPDDQGIPAQKTHRYHCIIWPDWITQAVVERKSGIHLSMDYYYWSLSWFTNGDTSRIEDRQPGLFTGSGFPMPYADLDGSIVDIYQAATHIVNENHVTDIVEFNTVIGNALGPKGYYGMFGTHDDFKNGSQAFLNAMLTALDNKDVPIITAQQALTWLDARNKSTFSAMSWNGTDLNFTLSADADARNLTAMVPVNSATNTLNGVFKADGSAVDYSVQTIKGIAYAFFEGDSGPYVARYSGDLDSTPPTVSITSPLDASQVTGTISISVDATDNVGVVGVQYLLDGVNLGAEDSDPPYTIDWDTTGVDNGSYTLQATARDAAGNTAISASVTVEVLNLIESLWTDGDVPGVPEAVDSGAVELGVRFKSDIDGRIKGIRFYKGAGNTGTHIGKLWRADGTRLGTVTFTGETPQGWQIALFPNPIDIVANETYIASYHAPVGKYSADNNYFDSARNRPPLRAPSGAESGGNGVYLYGSGGFPTNSYENTNYWVDVIFEAAGQNESDTIPPSVSISAPANDATISTDNVSIQAAASDNFGVVGVQFQMNDVNIGSEDLTAPYSINWPVVDGFYSLTAIARDAAGNTKTSSPVTISVSVSNTSPSVSLWDESIVPGSVADNDTNAVELGVKFTANVDGVVNGIKFYKADGNNGPHVGNLWTKEGVKIGSANFTAESASGWQQVIFDIPVAIVAGTTYVVSYHAPNGNYSFDLNYFVDTSRSNGPLTAPASVENDGNGIYAYGASAFPDATYQGANYWVDVIFTPN